MDNKLYLSITHYDDPWLGQPELKTKSAAFHWLQKHVPEYKEQRTNDIRQNFIAGIW